MNSKRNDSTHVSNSNLKNIDDKKLGTERLAKMSTSKYTPTSKNNDADLSAVDHWCEIRTKHVPARRSFHCSWNFKDYIYLFGGVNLNKGKNSEFYKINLAQQTPAWNRFQPKNADIIQPLAYSGCSTYEEAFYIIGGQSSELKQVNTIYRLKPVLPTNESVTKSRNENQEQEIEEDTILLTEDELEKVEVSGMPYIEGHCTATSKNGIYFFGGFSNARFSNKLYFFDPKKKTVTEVITTGDQPQERISSSCVIYLDKLYLYGGQEKESKYLKDFWIFDIEKNTWTEVKSKENFPWPIGRSGHTMNLYNNEIYIFGGRTNNVMEVNELWKFSPVEKTFEIIQESLIEQYITDDHLNESEEKTRGRKIGSTSFKIQHMSTNVKMSDHSLSKKKREKQSFNQDYEDAMYKCFPPLSLMNNSLIYNMDTDSSQWKKMMMTLTSKANQNNFISIMGNIPTPRDGHSSIIYRDYLVVFGGDRNKFPLNDLYTFIF